MRRVEEAARAAGLAITVRRMGVPTRTAEEAAAAVGCAVGQIVKSLVFRGAESGRLVLLLVSGANRVDPDRAAEAAGEALVRADADEVRARTGFAIGGVAPLGHREAPRVFIDRDLMGWPVVRAAAGAPDALFEVAPGDLARATGARIFPLA